MKTRNLVFALATICAMMPVQAQVTDEFNPPRAACCLINNARGLVNSATALSDQLQDWNQLSRYDQANQDLKKHAAPAGRVVFMGTRSRTSGTWSSISQ